MIDGAALVIAPSKKIKRPRVELPKVAIFSAVETVLPRVRSTMEAAAICKMANRNQIVGGIVDGPLAFDNAISPEAAQTKGIVLGTRVPIILTSRADSIDSRITSSAIAVLFDLWRRRGAHA